MADVAQQPTMVTEPDNGDPPPDDPEVPYEEVTGEEGETINNKKKENGANTFLQSSAKIHQFVLVAGHNRFQNYRCCSITKLRMYRIALGTY